MELGSRLDIELGSGVSVKLGRNFDMELGSQGCSLERELNSKDMCLRETTGGLTIDGEELGRCESEEFLINFGECKDENGERTNCEFQEIYENEKVAGEKHHNNGERLNADTDMEEQEDEDDVSSFIENELYPHLLSRFTFIDLISSAQRFY